MTDGPSGRVRTRTARRRGAVLEAAILRAAVEELTESGYAGLTMDRVAKRARTNKNAIYRRWPSRAALGITAYRKLVAADLRQVYRAATAEEARQHLEAMMLKWTTYPSVGQVWQRNWERITPFFHYPADIRKAIYTTNSVEALHRSLRKIIKTRGAFPNEESALKLIFLAIRQAAKKWTMPVNNWSQALNYFTVLWPERMTRPGRLA